MDPRIKTLEVDCEDCQKGFAPREPNHTLCWSCFKARQAKEVSLPDPDEWPQMLGLLLVALNRPTTSTQQKCRRWLLSFRQSMKHARKAGVRLR